jgi:hypothetical protein
MICQSWKVMFQAEYSSGSPLRMLVDLRASVEHALGRGKPEAEGKAKPGAPGTAKPAVAAKAVVTPAIAKAAPAAKTAEPAAKAAAAATTARPVAAPAAKPSKPAPPKANAPEFEVSSSPGWDQDSALQPPKKK